MQVCELTIIDENPGSSADRLEPVEVAASDNDGAPAPLAPPDDETILSWSCDLLGPSADRRKRFDFRNVSAWMVSIAIHAVALAIGFYLFGVAYRRPGLSFQKGDGAMAGVYLQSTPSQVDEALLPRSTEAQQASSSKATAQPAAESDAVIPHLFAAADPPAPEIIAADTVQFGIGNPNPLQQAPTPRHPGIRAAASHASPRPVADAPEPKPTEAGSNGGTQREHVRTPPYFVGKEGAQGTGGSRDGVDDRNLPIPDYPVISRRRGEQGVVELEIEVLPDGKVGKVTVRKDGGFPRLAAAATAAMENAHLNPATLDGAPVAGKLIVPYHFVLK